MLIDTTRERAPVATDPANGAALPLKPSHPHSIFHYISEVYAAGNHQPDLVQECAA